MTVSTTFQDFVNDAAAILVDGVEEVVIADVKARLTFDPPTPRRRDWRVKLFSGRKCIAEWDGWTSRKAMAEGTSSVLFSVELGE